MSNPNITARIRTRIRSALRRVHMQSGIRSRILEKAKDDQGLMTCESCQEKFKFKKDMDLDHIEPVGPTPGSRVAPPDRTWDDLINNMFCDESNYQVVCKACHKGKTRKDKKNEQHNKDD